MILESHGTLIESNTWAGGLPTAFNAEYRSCAECLEKPAIISPSDFLPQRAAWIVVDVAPLAMQPPEAEPPSKKHWLPGFSQK